MDQPLFAITKKTQWEFGDEYNEDKYVIMFGPLRTEMTYLKMLGEYFSDSKLHKAFVDSQISTSGKADGIFLAKHVTRTCYAYQLKKYLFFTIMYRSLYLQMKYTMNNTIIIITTTDDIYNQKQYVRCQ